MPAPSPLALLTLLAMAATAVDPPEACNVEMNKSKDLLQVSCVAKGLSSLPAGLPKETGILHLGSNHLAQVSLASFQHLSRLSDLDLSNNSLGALEAGSPLPELQQLVLSHNALASLPTFPVLPRLRRLALGHNALSQLPEGGFRVLKVLKDLELQGNRLRQLPPGAFAGLDHLWDLDLSDNDLESLPQDLLFGLKELEILRLERNQLQNLPDGFFPEETPFAFVYLEKNPWRCDCQLVYLRSWILDYEVVYTRVPGPEKEITENNPQSVKCHTPATAKGQPVIDFQMACRGLGDWENEGSDEVTTWYPTTTTRTTPPTTPALRTTAVLPTHTRNPAAATPAGTTVHATDSLPSTAALPPPTSSTTLGPSTATPATRGSTEAASTSSSSTPPPRVSTQATALAQVPTTPSMPTTMPETTQPPPASTATSHPPARPTALTLPAVTANASDSPSPPVSTRPPARLPSPELPVHCPCPALPAQVRRSRRHHRAPGSWAAWLANRCCLLHLVLYAASLALVLLPTLAVLCGVGCLHRSWHRPALPGAPRGRPGTYRRLGEAEPTAPWLGSAEMPQLVAGAQLYRVCKTFQVAPFRQASWLLVSLPGPGKPKPQKGGPRRPSLYSLDQGKDAMGAVRVKYATSSL